MCHTLCVYLQLNMCIAILFVTIHVQRHYNKKKKFSVSLRFQSNSPAAHTLISNSHQHIYIQYISFLTLCTVLWPCDLIICALWNESLTSQFSFPAAPNSIKRIPLLYTTAGAMPCLWNNITENLPLQNSFLSSSMPWPPFLPLYHCTSIAPVTKLN